MKMLEFLVFSAIASGLHLGALAIWSPDQGAEDGGTGGTATITVASVSGAYADLLREWDTAPEPQQSTEQPIPIALPVPVQTAPPAQTTPKHMTPPQSVTPPPVAETVPQTPHQLAPVATPPVSLQTPSLPAPQRAEIVPPRPQAPATVQDLARPISPQPSARQTTPNVDETPVPAQGALATSKRPKIAPRRISPAQTPKKPIAKAAPTRKAQTGAKAAGSGNGQTAGQATKKRTTSTAKPKSGNEKSLKLAWAARIKAKIQRNMGRVTNAAKARVTIGVKVSTKGKLLGVTLVRSSGNSKLDQQALRAARSARVFPRAPKGLSLPYYQFNIRLRYN